MFRFVARLAVFKPSYIENCHKKITRQNVFTSIHGTYYATLATKKPNIMTEREDKDFMSTFPGLARNLKVDYACENNFEVSERFSRALEYNVLHGKKLFASTLTAFYKFIVDPEELTDENVRLANILGWCIQMIHTASLIVDDMQDSSVTRHGTPCWYLQEEVGMHAINDAKMVICGVYSILRRYLAKSHCYVPVMELLHESILKTTMGQTLDLMCLKKGIVAIDSFDMARYNSLVEYKTAYLFNVPILMAMHLRGGYDRAAFTKAGNIFFDIGQYFQVQNDFLDCFGDPLTTGKKGTDIQNGACSWLVVKALQLASPAQRQLLKKNYGQSNPENEAVVRTLYEDLDLCHEYNTYEKVAYNSIRARIERTSRYFPPQFFYTILDMIHKRSS